MIHELPNKTKWINDIKYVMNLHGITQRQVADDLGITYTWMSFCLTGKREATYERIDQIQTAVFKRVEEIKKSFDDSPSKVKKSV